MYKHFAAVMSCAIAAGASGHSMAAEAAGQEPVIASYSFDVEAKILTDRRNRGISDTFNAPGAELTLTAAHESGWIGYLQAGSVRKEVFPDSKGLQLTAAAGYRWGRPDGWHFGAGLAQEWFPHAKVNGAPSGFDWASGAPTGVADTRFDTTYGLFEFAYGLIEARYLHVLSKDLRGNNTATLCGSAYLPGVLAGGDPGGAIRCYGDGLQHTRGSHLFDVNARLPLGARTKLLTHLGYQRVKHFSGADLLDYRVGVMHTLYGVDVSLELVGTRLKDRNFAIATDSGGRTERLDKATLVASVGKRF